MKLIGTMGKTAVILSVSLILAHLAAAAEPASAVKAASGPTAKPKPLSVNADNGLAWLAKHQLESGAWGQGEESAGMGGGASLKDTPSLGDTCMALLSLMRAGNTPEKGTYANNVREGVKYVCGQVAESDPNSLPINKTAGTRIQAKLGRYIDTFMTCTMLAEVQEKTADQELLKEVTACLEKVVRKMEKNQRPDGTWGDGGWAQTLEQQMAVKGMNKAAMAGVKVDETVRARAAKEAQDRFDSKSGDFSAKGSAGVGLYAAASSLGAQTDNAAYDAKRETELRAKLAAAATQPAEKAAIEKDLARYEDNRNQLKATTQAVVKKLEDDRFLAGFGSNGGEEFLSHLAIGEALVCQGGDDWTKWDRKMSDNMNRIQNADGSWTGHHCITGRTFCTSAALLVLMVDRSPVPVAAKIRQR